MTDAPSFSRKSLIENFEGMIDSELAYRKAKESAIFEEPVRAPSPDLDGPEWGRLYLLAQEREAVGFYLSGHPLDGMEEMIEAGSTISASQIPEAKDGEYVTVAGVITFLEVRRTRKGDDMATVTIEDFTGSVDCVFFPGSYRDVRHGLSRDSIAFIGGRVDLREGSPQIVATSLSVPDLSGGKA